jgi:hypothetical protein
METYILRKSDKKGKRFDLVMPERGHVHSFGAAGGKTFVDGRTEKEKAAWIARHKNDKGYNNKHAGIYYSRHLLWGPFSNLKKNVKALEKELGVRIKVQV